MRKAKTTAQFKKDCKTAGKRGWCIEDLQLIIGKLLRDIPLPPGCCDHGLVGQYVGCRECHVAPDWFEKAQPIGAGQGPGQGADS